MNRVVEAVKLKQGDMNDSEFARSLGISRTGWIYLKSGQREPGKKFYSIVKKKYPDLIPLLITEI